MAEADAGRGRGQRRGPDLRRDPRRGGGQPGGGGGAGAGLSGARRPRAGARRPEPGGQGQGGRPADRGGAGADRARRGERGRRRGGRASRAAWSATRTTTRRASTWRLALVGKGDADGAIDALLELFRRDREWNDGAAKTQLFKLFDSLGPKSEAAAKGRRRLLVDDLRLSPRHRAGGETHGAEVQPRRPARDHPGLPAAGRAAAAARAAAAQHLRAALSRDARGHAEDPAPADRDDPADRDARGQARPGGCTRSAAPAGSPRCRRPRTGAI